MRMVVYQSVRKGRNPVDVALGVHVLSVCFLSQMMELRKT